MILKLKRTPGIYLVGFMGCGKSTVGRALADELGWSFFDLDDEIEGGAGSTISEIFDTQGEPIFRALEAAALAKRVRAVQSGRPQVIALGGGALMQDENFELIANNGVTVWLDAPYELIEKRVAAESHRPLARDPQKLRELFDVRCPRYGLADFRVEAPEEEAMATVRRILELPLF
jgi:shikimate kinase